MPYLMTMPPPARFFIWAPETRSRNSKFSLALVEHDDVDHVTLVWSELQVVDCVKT